MKKGLLLIFAAGTLLVSCGGEEKAAAKEFCGCYEGMMAAQEKAGSAESTDDMFSAQTALAEEAQKAMDCLVSWKEKYDGKVDIEKVKEEIKAENAELYKMIEEQGAI